MFLFRRIIPYIAAFTTLVSFLLILNTSFVNIYWLLAANLIPLIFLAAVLWYLGGPLSKKEKIHFISLVVFFVLGGFLFIFFNTILIWNYALAFLASLFVGFFTEHIFLYVWNPAAYEPYSIEYFSRALQYGILFLFSSFIFFIDIAGFSQAIVIAAGSILALLSGVSFFLTQKINLKEYRPLLAALFLIFAQIFTVISFFPFDPKVSALIMTIAFYVFTGIVRQKFHRTEVMSRVQGYIVIGIASISLLLLTARWR